MPKIATLLTNSAGERWCSYIHCDFIEPKENNNTSNN
jgi:hypothetical protein